MPNQSMYAVPLLFIEIFTCVEAGSLVTGTREPNSLLVLSSKTMSFNSAALIYKPKLYNEI